MRIFNFIVLRNWLAAGLMNVLNLCDGMQDSQFNECVLRHYILCEYTQWHTHTQTARALSPPCLCACECVWRCAPLVIIKFSASLTQSRWYTHIFIYKCEMWIKWKWMSMGKRRTTSSEWKTEYYTHHELSRVTSQFSEGNWYVTCVRQQTVVYIFYLFPLVNISYSIQSNQ